MDAEILSKINDLNVTRHILRQFYSVNLIKADCMNIVCEMFNKRDDRIWRSYNDVNQDSQNFENFKSSIFYGSHFVESLISDPIRDNVDNNNSRPEVLLHTAHRLYLTYKSLDDATDNWCLLIVDIPLKKIFYIDPKLDINSLSIDDNNRVENLMETFEIALNPFLSRTITTYEENWECEIYPHINFSFLQNDFDSGVYIAVIIYFLVQDCPLTFQESDMSTFRENYAYWILNESLPM